MGKKISDLGPTAGLAFTHLIETETSLGASEKATLTDVKNLISGSFSYVSGNWYWISPPVSIGTSTATPAANQIYFIPVVLPATATWSQLGFRIGSTPSTSGNASLAIYASANSLPTGTALATTASAPTTANGNVTIALSATVTLKAGTLYFVGINNSAASGGFAGALFSSTFSGFYTGAATAAALSNATSGVQYEIASQYRFASTFGTWPDVTGVTFTTLNSSTTCLPHIMGKVN